MNPSDIAMLSVLTMLLALIVVELVKPARQFEKVKGWRLKGLLFTLLMFALGGAAPAVLGALIPADLHVLPGDRLGNVGGALVGIVTFEFIGYWVHRLHHRVGFLWRWIHQTHHAAERVDIFGAGFFHPFEMIESTLLPMLFCGVLLGLNSEAVALVGAWGAFNAFFQHGNIKTPAWLGYVIQRPEQHGVHHERGVHAFNYGNLMIWDHVFGTFRNPETWQAPAGFFPGSSKKMLRLMLGRDISNDQPAATRELESQDPLPAPVKSLS
jgi:sterol desaturase/sphingolipid hydroxylase (fatty acid hydroxylase superfamily)